MAEPTTVETLLYLDSLLTWLADERTAAAVGDNIPMAESIDEKWKVIDQDRQDLIARASDRDLISYEIAREPKRQY